jgi:hypothetical protein
MFIGRKYRPGLKKNMCQIIKEKAPKSIFFYLSSDVVSPCSWLYFALGNKRRLVDVLTHGPRLEAKDSYFLEEHFGWFFMVFNATFNNISVIMENKHDCDKWYPYKLFRRLEEYFQLKHGSGNGVSLSCRVERWLDMETFLLT